MNGKEFTEEDYNALVKFMNFIHQNATFKDSTPAMMMEYAKLYGLVGKNVLPKIKDHQFEVNKVIEPEDNKESK
jgi:hypothetical protein